jgi:hypothetical protein
MAEWFKAHAWKVPNAVFQVLSHIITLDFIGDFQFRLPHQFAEIGLKRANSIKWQYQI